MPKREKRGNLAKHWVFTWFKYPDDALVTMVTWFQGMEWRAGKEVCPSTGTPHLQGMVWSKTRFRPFEKPWDKKIHWEIARGDKEANLKYVMKDGDSHGNIDLPEEIDCPSMYGWQTVVINSIVDRPVDKRAIWFFWSTNGALGKSSLVRWLAINREALVVSGKGADIKYMCTTRKKPPKLIVFDVPREAFDYISWTAVEEVKNGVFCSPKYESTMMIMNHPTVLLLANFHPPEGVLSADRWRIANVEELGGHGLSRMIETYSSPCESEDKDLHTGPSRFCLHDDSSGIGQQQ